MTTTFKAAFTMSVAAAVMLLAQAAPVAQHGHEGAQDPKAVTVTGAWQLSTTGDHAVQSGLVLDQKGTKVTGTLSLMGTNATLAGEFVDGQLSLKSSGEVADPHGNKTSVEIVATLKTDGTLEGKYATRRGSRPFTGERFRKPS